MSAQDALPPLNPLVPDVDATQRVHAAPDALRPLPAQLTPDPDALGGWRDASWLPLGHSPLLAVGPGRPEPVTPIQPARNTRSVSGFPIQLAKVQPPPLRADVLSRERLNSWLETNARRRVVLIVAEAGYGKTTLLADWSAHSPRRTLWYRLHSDDRDWLTLLNHLVGSGRQLDPSFGEEAEELIGSLGPGGPTRAAIVTALVRELSELSEGGATLIFDDFQAVDESEDVISIVQALIERTAPSLTFILASRRRPPLSLARLRGQREISHLTSSDLRFDIPETDRLFRETYHQPLDAEVLLDLNSRTEGWAASLELVHQAVATLPTSQIGEFVHGLSGDRGDLHNFLAEEVIAGQPEAFQLFLMKAALLETIEPEAVTVVTGPSRRHVDEFLDAATKLCLLRQRVGTRGSELHFHPLVKDFLEGRIRRELGDEGVRSIHLAVGAHFKGRDWRVAARHYALANDMASVQSVIRDGLDQVLARGETAVAHGMLNRMTSVSTHVDILESRMLLQRGEFGSALAAARRAVDSADHGSPDAGAALINFASLLASGSWYDELRDVITRAKAIALTPEQARIAEAMEQLVQVSNRGPLLEVERHMSDLARHQRAAGQDHYLGVTYLNLATVPIWTGEPQRTLRYADEADRLLGQASSGFERNTVHQLRGRALGQLGKWAEARLALHRALEFPHPLGYAEAVVEGTETAALFGDTETVAILAALLSQVDVPQWSSYRATVQVLVALRLRDVLDLAKSVELLKADRRGIFNTCGRFRREFALARAALALGSSDAEELIGEASRTAKAQNSTIQMAVTRLLAAAASGPRALDVLLEDPAIAQPHISAMVAEELLDRADELEPTSQVRLGSCIGAWPHRWLGSLRYRITTAGAGQNFAAHQLDQIGTMQDVPLLRAYAKAARKSRRAAPMLGQAVIRRHAPRVFVEDMGRVRVLVDGAEVDPGSVRRKALALLCFLLTQPTASATRDQVLEALWPDFGPETAGNSLNQTIYFLRRVIEADFQEDATPGYVRYEGDVVWLDTELVSCRSRAARLILAGEAPGPQELFQAYPDRFATDFAYEEWAETHRNNLHAAFLAQIEKITTQLCRSGNWPMATAVAQRALMIDPSSDALEALLLRVYRDSGAHSAAAEQYEHYAATLRADLGVEPPTLEEL